MNIILSVAGRQYEIEAKDVTVESSPAAAKETVQQRAAAVKAAATDATAGPGPEKAEIPTELPKATGRKRGQATNPATVGAPKSVATAAIAAAPTAIPVPAAAKPAADMPTAVQLDAYRVDFMNLVKALVAAGAEPKNDVPVGKQLTALLLKFSKVNAASELTITQWNTFFDKVNTTYVNGPAGLAGLIAKL